MIGKILNGIFKASGSQLWDDRNGCNVLLVPVKSLAPRGSRQETMGERDATATAFLNRLQSAFVIAKYGDLKLSGWV